MAFKINGVTVLDDNREITVNGITATANDRIFVGVTATDTTALSPSIFQGSVSGYTAGGGPLTNVIQKFPFSTDTNATDVGDLNFNVFGGSSQSSTTHGYNSGGYFAAPSDTKAIQKFSFAVDSNATNVGNLQTIKRYGNGQSSESHGYMSGGYAPGFGAFLNTIDKFPFAVDSNSSDVGNLTSTRASLSGPGQSSTTHGYVSGGYVPGPNTVNTIDKFPFSTDTNATDIGDLSQARRFAVGQSSTTHGYTSGGNEPTPATKYNTIDKFPFSSDTNASDVGDLSEVKGAPSGQSSTTSGYASGGTAGPGNSNVIDKFPFASDTNASDIGDLLAIIEQPGGQQARTIQ